MEVIIEFHGITSIKEKRREMNSVKSRLIRKFRMSVAEIDLQQSLQFAQIGCAYVSNKKGLGDAVMQKALHFIESNIAGRVHDCQMHAEQYG